MRLLVTRPEPDATALKAQLIAQGHEVLVEPLLEVELLPPDDIDLLDAQALIATSRNALRALAESSLATEARRLPLYAVGPGTASTARALGFLRVVEGPKDALALAGVVAETAEVNAGPLVYLCGEVTAADLAGELRRLGFHVQEPVVYRMKAAARLSAPILARFTAREIDGVLLMSPQTARVYLRLLDANGLTASVTGIMHYCLSPAVARVLSGRRGIRAVHANAPNLTSLLALVAERAPELP